MKIHGKILSAYCFVKETSLKRLHMVHYELNCAPPKLKC